jgi:hypothetical protein
MIKHLNAVVTTQCFLVGAPMPPKGLRKFVYHTSCYFGDMISKHSKGHYCHDWDGDFIYADSPEASVCTCYHKDDGGS